MVSAGHGPLCLYRFDRVHGDPVKGHFAGIDELVPYAAGYLHRVPSLHRVLLAAAHKNAGAPRDECLVLPFVDVVWAGFPRSVFHVQHDVGRNSVSRAKQGVSTPTFVANYRFHE